MALYVDIPSPALLQRLLGHRALPSISIYLSTGRLAADARVAQIELSTLIDEALGRLRIASEDDRVVSELATMLEDLHGDDEFWVSQADSLAVFASTRSLQTFRLPTALESVVVVSDRYHVKPLLRSVTFPHEAFVLALAEGSVRLLEFGPTGPPREVDVPDLPRDAHDPRSNKVVRARPATYVRRIDQALRPVLNGMQLPLVLAATDAIAARYRTVNTYPHLAEERIVGNPETTDERQLVESARALLDRIYAGELAEVIDLLELRTSQGRSATDLSDVARLSTLGAVDTLLVDINSTVLGSIDEDSGAITFADAPTSPGDSELAYGLVDEMARRVLGNGGRVLAVREQEIPSGAPVAAILRFAV